MRLPCSVPILTLNVREHLERLLPVLLEQFEDVFLVDGNSTDGTQEYARSLGVRVERQGESAEPNQRITDFTAARHRSWGFAKHDWIFLVDSDEIPSAELVERVAVLVQQNETHVAHRFLRVARLPDGRVVQHAFFYPEQTMIRLFARSSGMSLTSDRRVHERFAVPSGVRVETHAEAFMHTWKPVEAFKQRLEHYLVLEERPDAHQTAVGIWRWMIWYNLRSGMGQVARAIGAALSGFLRHETVLPWAYTIPLIAYRFRLVGDGIRAWRGIRR